MFTMSYSVEKNRITVVATTMTKEEAKQYVVQFTEIMKQVRPGFTGLTDLSSGVVLTQEVAAILAPTGEMAQKHGTSTEKKWAYVTHSKVYELQMQRLFRDLVEYRKTREDAEAYLDGSMQLQK